jgi:predicted ATP-grasp superfamily ATP-dependent carboligase
VCAHQDRICDHAAVAVPTLDAFDAVSDKAALLERADRAGVPIPRTHFVSGLPRLRDVLHEVEYPAVVKPSRSRIPCEGGWTRASVHYAYSANELQHLYQCVPYLSSSPSLIQQRIVGPGIGAFMLFDRGKVICEFGHRRLREKPPAGGVSVLRESTPVRPEIKEYATRVLGELCWHGPAMMEFKQDDRTGQLYLMEVNGRFWGSLQLAIDAGVDFPLLVTELALGRGRRWHAPYRIGVRSRWLLGDLDHLYLRLSKRDRDLRLPPSAPSRLRTLMEFLKLCQRNTRYEIARLDDPRPFLHELGQAIASASAAGTGALLRALGRRTRAEVSDPVIGHAQ